MEKSGNTPQIVLSKWIYRYDQGFSGDIKSIKDTVMKIEKVQINDRLRVSKVS